MRRVFQIWIWLVVVSAVLPSAYGQKVSKADMEVLPDFRVYEVDGELIMFGELKGIDITAKKPGKRAMRRGRKKMAKYTKLRWNIHRVYPYALKVSETLAEVETELHAFDTEEEKKEYLSTKEKALFGRYEQDLRKMTRSQGKVLVKLVYRQTGRATYYLIKEYKNGASAFFWQSIGMIFGVNLKSDYDSEEEFMIEAIVADLERGGYNIYYKTYDYLLN
ncbi:MAG: DUF4294 domain-containing protein [Bacteroidota bacterium]